LPGGGRITFQVGDMTDPAFGSFDHIVAMDSLIHYRAADMARVAGELAARARTSVLFTFAPRTVLLSVMHAAGRLFPRGDRAPAIEPVREATLRRLLGTGAGLHPARTLRVKNGFYISQAMELARI
jgi:magnesium-protoporphyrin O-methyltransferase